MQTATLDRTDPTGGLQLAFPQLSYPPQVVGATHRERWEAFKQHNPRIVDDFVAMAIEAVNRGHNRIGVKYLVEVYRWERKGHRPGDRFKFNNNWTSHLARDLIAAQPQLRNHISTRAVA